MNKILELLDRFWKKLEKSSKNTGKTIIEVIKGTVDHVSEAQLLTVSSSLAYITILSVVPLLSLSFAFFQAFGGLQKFYDTIAPLILSRLSEGSSEEVSQFLTHFISNARAEVFGIGGFIGLVFTSMSMLWSIEKAINRIWGVQPKQNFFQRFAVYWLFISLGPLALSVAIATVTASQATLGKLFPGSLGMFLIGSSFFILLYKFIPNIQVKFLNALISSVVTAAFWDLARLGYTFYTRRFVSYNKIYGSLGAIPILLVWIYIMWVIVLGGAAFTAALQRRGEGHPKKKGLLLEKGKTR